MHHRRACRAQSCPPHLPAVARIVCAPALSCHPAAPSGLCPACGILRPVPVLSPHSWPGGPGHCPQSQGESPKPR
eukprot:scaffold590_cov383-Prasinococcus_capsulatus_cf.AAC.11